MFGRNAGRHPLSGSGAASLPGARRVHVGAGGSVAARDEPAPLARADGRVLGRIPQRCRGAQRNDVEVRPPDVNRSDVWSTVDGGSLRVGLGFVRNWSEDTATATVLERERRGPFRSVGDFVRRTPPDLKRTAIEALVWVGGCDGFGLTRRELLWQVGLSLPPKTERSGDGRGRRQLE